MSAKLKEKSEMNTQKLFPCPVCQSSESNFHLCEVDGYAIRGCKRCGAEFVSPMPDAEMLKAYYDRKQWFEGGERGGYEDYDRQTSASIAMIKPLLETYGTKQGLSILDVGCGYGSHLNIAAELGWKCFGVELSDYARKIAQSRLEGRAYIVESAADLIPHEFDVVLMLDVIEHFPDPYPLFFSLFSIGAITPKTRVIISTPNAGSSEAEKNPKTWVYRHPPSHLVYFHAETLRFFLQKLRFTNIDVHGIYPLIPEETKVLTFADYGGLVAIAEGSDFTEFMHERYVPGTWSKIAEYEHLPRYELARRFVQGKAVLDFGCGSGYGSAMLAECAAKVVGLDVDASAIDWAKTTHCRSGLNLEFYCCDDLGGTLPEASFDVVTCFEMIEHVNFETQCATLASAARLLRDDGILIISTPNPEVTSLYGENPYHLREMSRDEFLDLLSSGFAHIYMLDQRVRESVTFDDVDLPKQALEILGQQKDKKPPLAYIAFCSKTKLQNIVPAVVFNNSRDVIRDFLSQENKVNLIRLACYSQNELLGNQSDSIKNLNEQLSNQLDSIKNLNEQLSNQLDSIQKLNITQQILKATLDKYQIQIEMLTAKITELNTSNISLQNIITEIKSSNWYQLGVVLRTEKFSWQGIRTAVILVAKVVLPKSIKRILRNMIRNRDCTNIVAKAGKCNYHQAYCVKQPIPVLGRRPCVVHIIANFCLGGSSRLVIDLIESLGQFYEHKILTSYAPNPPAYQGVEIDEISYVNNEQPFIAYLKAKKADFIHFHYWGECDEPWYTLAIRSAEQLGLKVIENINTPIVPYISPSVYRYVYVSDYVRHEFGQDKPEHITIYPGSDFSLFMRKPDDVLPENCIGMVYRLETDKLNEFSIVPLIKAVQKRPNTKALVVGGGSLLEVFQKAVQAAGLNDKFDFTGYVSYDSLPDYYRKMTVFVAPVWKESFGQVSPFAMSMRIPVCGYDVGAIGEITDDRDVLAPAGDADRLADIIVRLLDDAEERKRIGDFQCQRAQSNFSVQAMVDSYARLYRELTGIPE